MSSSHDPTASGNDTAEAPSEEAEENLTSQHAVDVSIDKHNRLIDWAKHHDGYLHPAVKIQYGADRGFHAIVASGQNIAASTTIARAPTGTTISVLNALDVPTFGNRGSAFPEPFLYTYQYTTEVLQTLYLMEQKVRGEQSFWAAYIATLPTVDEIRDLQFESEEDAIWIRGTNVEAAVQLQNQKWRGQFDQAIDQLVSLGWQNAVNGTYTWDLYRWAASIFGSRSFSSQVLSDTAAADQARPLGAEDPQHEMLSKLFSDRFAVLLPVLDIFNHNPMAKVEWQAEVTTVGLQVLTGCDENEEIFNNYGPRDNEGLLIAYGFVLEDNPFDHITIAIYTPPGSSLEEARTWPKDERSNDDHRCFLYDAQHQLVEGASYLERALFSYDLLDSISVLIANDREFQNMYENQQTLVSFAFPAGYSDFRNLLAAISQIMQECKARLQRVQVTDPTRFEPPLRPQSTKQKYALTYREKLVKTLQTAISICTIIILHASTDQSTSDLLLTMQLKFPEVYSEEVEKLITKKRFLTTGDELFTLERLLQTLPSPTANAIRVCLQSIKDALQDMKEERSHIESIKTGFAIMFSALCVESRSGVELSARLQAWTEFLITSYPPEDEHWSYVPSAGPWEDGEEPPPGLMTLLKAAKIVRDGTGADSNLHRWLDPQLVCWGWNVMDEEAVRVPVELEAFHSEAPEEVTGPMGFLMYCKQHRAGI